MSRRKATRGAKGTPRQASASRNTTLWFVAVASLSLVVAAVASVLLPVGGPIRDIVAGSGSSGLRAAIVDQLSLTAPGQAFVEDATAQLKESGYSVDYYSGEEVTVDFYRTLPQQGYDLLLLRTHSTAVIERGDEAVTSVSLFTNEPYDSNRYYEEQQAGRLGFASYEGDNRQYFGITADFIEKSMQGKFDDTLVVMMGCDGLRNDRGAQAFIGKGASSFISWNQFVTAPHTDAATERLLKHLLGEGLSPGEAVNQTMLEVGPDPHYGSLLKAYPSSD